MDRYIGLTLQTLREELKKRGANVSGRKKDLVERLEAYDRNQNFGRIPDEPSSRWTMDLPDVALYSDITSTSVIPLTEKETIFYLDTCAVQLGKKSKHLYDERFLRYAKSCVHAENIFIKLQCRAEMKKGMTYDIDMQLGLEGNVVACQCDCTAGMGPQAHCKHVCTALYGMLDFVSTKAINVERSCTDRLQSFHQPSKLHTGSPVKSQDLGLIDDVQNVIFDPLEEWTDETDIEFNTRFRTVIINDSVRREVQMPFMQLFGPAATAAVDMDHDYLQSRQSDIFLEEEGITKISSERISQIEEETRGQRKNPLWKTERMKRLQSSNFGRVAKATSRTDKAKLAASLMIPKDLYCIRAVRHGIDNEDAAIAKYEEVTGNTVTRIGIVVDKDRPFLGTSVDGITDICIVEVKCPFTAKGKKIDHVTVPYLKKTSNGLQLDQKHDYFYQIQGQLYITKKYVCHLVVYTIEDLQVIEVPANAEFMGSMLDKLDCFFADYFKPIYLQTFFFKDYSLYN